MPKYIVVEIDIGNDFYEHYSGIRYITEFSLLDEAESFIEKEKVKRINDYNQYKEDSLKLAKEIMKNDSNRESKIRKDAFCVASKHSKFQEWTDEEQQKEELNFINYYLTYKASKYQEYNPIKEPIPTTQFMLDILEVPTS